MVDWDAAFGAGSRMTNLERRQSPRKRFENLLYVEVEPGNGGMVLNLSEQGFGFRAVRRVRPKEEVTRPFHKQAATGDLVLTGVTIHLLDEVSQPISSTAIRQAAAAGKPLTRFLDPGVGDYIKKTGLYKSGSP